jgi:hypothetical protein
MDQVVAIRPPARGIPRDGAPNLRDLDHGELAALARAHSPGPRRATAPTSCSAGCTSAGP